MADFVSDTMTDTDGTALASHTGETGASWTKHGSYSTGSSTITSNRVRGNGDNTYCVHYASGVPASADYSVAADIHKVAASATGQDGPGPEGRRSTSADTCYLLQHFEPDDTWYLFKIVAGVVTTLGTYASAIGVGVSVNGKLDMVGTAIKAIIATVERISVADSAISAAGRAAVRTRSSGAAAGYHVDNVVANEAGGAGILYTQLERNVRGMLRGMYAGGVG